MRRINGRVAVLFAFFAFLFCVAFARAAWLQGVEGGSLKASADQQQSDTVVVPGTRGRLLDRTGKPLALSEDSATVIATPYQVKDPDGTARRLAPLMGVAESDVAGELSDRSSGYAVLAHKIDLRSADEIRQMDIQGISLVPDSRRVYPQGELASQLIGAVNDENKGLTGLESGDQSVLGGSDGEQRVVNDAVGNPIRLETVKQASTGSDIKLTIDAAIQARTEDALQEIGDTYSPQGATAIVMDPRSSDVLAMANWPPFDPTDLADTSDSQLENRATNYTYEPGSTFKAFTVAAALSDHKVTPNTSFYLPPEIKVYDRTIGEAEDRPAEDLTVSQILAQSSNVGAVKIGQEVGSTRFDHWIRAFGFGEPTDVGYPGEERGIVPQLDDYSGSTMGNLPIGQGLAVTPIQMMEAYAAIANGGILRAPRLTEQVGSDEIPAQTGHRVITPQVAAQLRHMLEGVVEEGGTAASVDVPGYQLAGKTGTAQKVDDDGTYSDSRYVASFIGFAPAQDPGLLVAVIVDEPQGEHLGAEVAAPAFADIAEFALPYLGIAPN
jgi:cell division protein FtsI (penicillin-binding protein 3)